VPVLFDQMLAEGCDTVGTDRGDGKKPLETTTTERRVIEPLCEMLSSDWQRVAS